MFSNYTKKQKVFTVAMMLFIIVLWLSVFIIRSTILEKELNKELSQDFITELNGLAVQNVIVHLDNKDVGLQDVLDYNIECGDIIDVTVTYDDESTKDKQAYVTINTDEDEVLVKYTDGDYGQIKLPAKDIITPKEFKESLNKAIKEKDDKK